MKIVINKTKRLLFVGKLMVKPGTNVVEEGLDENDATVKSWVKARMISVKDSAKMDDEDIDDAIATAYDNGVVETLKSLSKDKGVQDAADEQARENDRKEKELEDALKESGKESKGKGK